MPILRNLGGNVFDDSTVKAGREAFKATKDVVKTGSTKVKPKNISSLIVKASGLKSFVDAFSEVKEIFDDAKDSLKREKDSKNKSKKIPKTKKEIVSKILGLKGSSSNISQNSSMSDEVMRNIESLSEKSFSLWDKEFLPKIKDIQMVLENAFIGQNSSFGKIETTLSKLLFFTENSATKAASDRAEKARGKIVNDENIIETKEFNEEVLHALQDLKPSNELTQKKADKEKDEGFSLTDIGLGLIGGEKILGVFSKMKRVFGGILGIFGKLLKPLPLLEKSLLLAFVGFKKLAFGLGVFGKIFTKFLGLPLLALQVYNEYQESGEKQKKYGNKSKLFGLDTSNLNAGVGHFLGGGGEGVANAIGSGAQGALTGAVIGSILPGVGTLIGGIIGGIVGTISGYFGGEKVAKFLSNLDQSVTDSVSSLYESVKSGFTYLMSIPMKMMTYFQETSKTIQDSIYNLSNYLVGKYFDFTDYFKDTGKSIASKIVDIKDSAIDLFSNFNFSGIISSFTDSISNIFTKINESLKVFVFDMLGSLGAVGRKTQAFLFTPEEIQKYSGSKDQSNTTNNSLTNNNVQGSKDQSNTTNNSLTNNNVQGSKDQFMNLIDSIKTFANESYSEYQKQQSDNSKSLRQPPTVINIPQKSQAPMMSPPSAPIIITPKPIRNSNYSGGSVGFVN
jgi:hypothetical protein